MSDGNGAKILALPDGTSVSTEEINTPYVVAQSGQNQIQEIIDVIDSNNLLKERKEYIKRQALVRAFENNVHVSDLLDIVLKEISEDLAHLKWDRRQAIKEGRNPVSYTIARIASLKTLADTIIKKRTS